MVHQYPAQPPAGGFQLRTDQRGEQALALTHLGPAVVLSNGCEIDNDRNIRTLALVRPLSDISADHRDPIREGRSWAAFYLPPDAAWGVAESFIDLRRLTTVHPDVIERAHQRARLTSVFRASLAEQFWNFLFRQAPGPSEDDQEP